jgi:archaellum component FlaF (FlaF/FlaG flagellin family)
MVGAVAVVTLDRRKLAAPLFAQAAAFVAVLVVGGFTGHTSATTTGAGATPSARASVTASPATSVTASSAASKGPTLKLTVKVVQNGSDGLSVAGSEVNVLRNGTLASVATGVLNPALEFAANVPAGQYQVCVSPPIGWASAVRGTHVLGSWICSAADLRTAPQLVTFRLTPQVPQVGQ